VTRASDAPIIADDAPQTMGASPKTQLQKALRPTRFLVAIALRIGDIYAKRSEDGEVHSIPQKMERNRDNPDGRNHLCAPPPSPFHPCDTVSCFALEGAT
jgi:hypothetical protein